MKLSFVDRDEHGNERGVNLTLKKRITVKQVVEIRSYYAKEGWKETCKTVNMTSREVARKAKGKVVT